MRIESREPDEQDLPVGTRVMKPTRKPFKSTLKTNTISGYCSMEIKEQMVPAYTFVEDDSHVERGRCVRSDEPVPVIPVPLGPTPRFRLPVEDLAKLPTPRLLAYYRKKIQGHNGPQEWDSQEVIDQWNAYQASVKALLATREHVGG